jgi:hypothetical protein
MAVEAHLDHVAGELLVGRVETLKLGRRGDTATVGPSQGVAVHVRHQAQAAMGADRAGARHGFADVPAGPQQLGVRVADLVTVEATGTQIPEHRSSGQRVVDVLPHAASVRMASPASIPPGSRLAPGLAPP